jgi:flagellar biosynthesis protein FliQ
MTSEGVMSMAHQAMLVGLLLAAPPLLVALVVGLVVSLFQAATQINEATLSFIPKLIAICTIFVIAGPWMLHQMLDYLRSVLLHVATLGVS